MTICNKGSSIFLIFKQIEAIKSCLISVPYSVITAIKNFKSHALSKMKRRRVKLPPITEVVMIEDSNAGKNLGKEKDTESLKQVDLANKIYESKDKEIDNQTASLVSHSVVGSSIVSTYLIFLIHNL